MIYFGTGASRNRHGYPDNEQEVMESGIVRFVWCKDLQKKMNDVWTRRSHYQEMIDGRCRIVDGGWNKNKADDAIPGSTEAPFSEPYY
jgi:hypothetical protein